MIAMKSINLLIAYSMKFIFLSFIFLTCIEGKLNSQQISSSFELAGTINVDTGRIELLPEGDISYYPSGIKQLTARIKNGHFAFAGTILYPYGLRLILRSSGNYISNYFYLEPGRQKIVCNADSIRETPQIINHTMTEYRTNYLPAVAAIKQKFDVYETLNDELKAMLFHYAKKRPYSYVALWEIVRQLHSGYDPLLDSAFMELSLEIKKSITGKALSGKLYAARVLQIGLIFPRLELLDTNNRNVVIPGKNSSKYILVDFWFSHCMPCLQQVPKYKEIYQQYSQKGFEIIAISIDNKKNIPAWKNVIREKNMNWIHYLDMDGKLSASLSIDQFPTNFLVDNSWKIISKNIEPDQLNSFLKEKSQ